MSIMRSKSRLSRYVVTLSILVIILSGCAEDSSPTNTKDIVDVIPSVESNFLPYEILSFSASGSFSSALGLVDSQNPAAISENSIVSTGSKITILPPKFNRTIFDPNEKTLSAVRLNTLLFTQDSKFYQIDLLNVIEPKREQLSAEFQVDGICHEWDVWAEDYANFGNSRYIYYIATDCQSNNGEWYMVKLSMDESDSSINLRKDINYFLSGITNASNGSLSGWLAVNQNGFLIHYDADFTQSELVRSDNINIQVQEHSQYLINNSQGQMLLAIDENIVWYNPVTNLLESIIEVFPAGQRSRIYQWRSDGIHLYFTVDHLSSDGIGVLTSSLHRVLLNKAIQIDVLSNNESAKIDNLEVGSSSVAYSVAGELKYVFSSNLIAANINPPDSFTLSLDAQGVPVFFVSGDMIIAEYSKTGSLANRAIKILNPNRQIDETLENNYIVGVVYQKEWRLDVSRVVEKFVFESQGAGVSSRVISALNPVEYPALLQLGELPADSNPRPLSRFYSLGHDDILIQGPINSVVELFFVDVTKANSLLRVTNNQITERVVDF